MDEDVTTLILDVEAMEALKMVVRYASIFADEEGTRPAEQDMADRAIETVCQVLNTTVDELWDEVEDRLEREGR